MNTNAIDKKMFSYSRAEQLVNAITHGIGTCLAFVGLCVLVYLASVQGDIWRIVSFSIYGTSLTLLMLNSTLYHSVSHIPARRILRILDHISIFLLIAGTYTPFALVSIKGAWGWSLFGTVWFLAISGIILKIFLTGRFEILSLVLYALMGWLVLVAIKPFVASIEPGGLWLTVAGGLAYTLGILFYAVEKIRFNHAIWHVFVLVGAACHYFAILLYVLPNNTL